MSSIAASILGYFLGLEDLSQLMSRIPGLCDDPVILKQAFEKAKEQMATSAGGTN